LRRLRRFGAVGQIKDPQIGRLGPVLELAQTSPDTHHVRNGRPERHGQSRHGREQTFVTAN
jgi:hypothetical protein